MACREDKIGRKILCLKRSANVSEVNMHVTVITAVIKYVMARIQDLNIRNPLVDQLNDAELCGD